jgi:hypothetical protein
MKFIYRLAGGTRHYQAADSIIIYSCGALRHLSLSALPEVPSAHPACVPMLWACHAFSPSACQCCPPLSPSNRHTASPCWLRP